jgi:tol-pal system protein YbgF
MMLRPLLLASAFAALAFSAVPAGAQLFGPSDEEKAHEAGQDSGIKAAQDGLAQQDARIRELEDRVRGLTQSLSQATGSNEELQHQIQVQNGKIDQMQRDFAYRLCQLSAQQLGAGDAMNCAATGTPSANNRPAGNLGGGAYSPPVAPQPYSQSGLQPGAALPPIDATGNGPNGQGGFTAPPPPPDDGQAIRGRPPGTLGTLPMGSGPGPAGAPAQLQGSTAGNSAQYDQAMNLMSRAQYNEASAQFAAYAAANPGDTDLSPQALYWVGNIAFVQQDYSGAAKSFANVIKKYPKSGRAPDAMLKLAQSFMGMGQKSEGCTTLGLIKSKYPNANPQTLSQAASLRRTACSK